jgi:hypothetical protein
MAGRNGKRIEMNMHKIIQGFAIALTFAASLLGCSYSVGLSGSIVFQFDLKEDNQHAAILDYKVEAMIM